MSKLGLYCKEQTSCQKFLYYSQIMTVFLRKCLLTGQITCSSYTSIPPPQSNVTMAMGTMGIGKAYKISMHIDFNRGQKFFALVCSCSLMK